MKVNSSEKTENHLFKQKFKGEDKSSQEDALINKEEHLLNRTTMHGRVPVRGEPNVSVPIVLMTSDSPATLLRF